MQNGPIIHFPTWFTCRWGWIMCSVSECDSLISLLTLICHFPKHHPPLLHTTLQPIRHHMTLINGVSPPLYFPSVSVGVLLWPETLNIQISIILIFKSINCIPPDQSKSNYLCSDRETHFVWWVTDCEKWGWMLTAFHLFCLFSFASSLLFDDCASP